ncbi:20 kDa chaperonin, chloroplastic [Gracilariopsis chorda]|uniref:20 kDa chaperonin, chloroplastic n=1 Tax=Gracilariopsis chorda TaxID=448386 RepID=A0A2V3IS45_9FLOR|nr:20 kDa chaperonin, chloroplastic [Gracilariopsis chorda]|eukprot:PXF44939.1 20 kDa chaperonin, chloroplastic [Gracilariopsis chorda]
MTAAAASHTVNGKSISGPLQPVGQNLLVKIAEAADTTAGGLILTGSAKEKPTYGEVVEAGSGKFFPNGMQVPMSISKGEYVLYGKYGGTDLDYDGDKHTIVTQDDVLCKLANGEYSASAVEPILDRLLVKVEESAEETSSGIILSKTAKEKSTSGKVVAMGPGRFMENGQTEPPAFAVGDTVFYGKYSGTEVEFGGDAYMLIRVADVYAKV